MTDNNGTIIYTIVDEAPALATWSLLPIIRSYCKGLGVDIVNKDISLAGRIIAAFSDQLPADQQQSDDLAELGQLTQDASTNIIKLPNISASLPQLKEAIVERQAKGYAIPDYPDQPANNEEEKIAHRYAGVLGSAVNPVLREGNSDRRAAESVKNFGRKNPHRMMKDRPEVSASRVAHMDGGDFYGSEKSVTMAKDCQVAIEFKGANENTTLKENTPLLAGEIIDASVMNVAKLRSFFADQIKEAKEKDLLLSLHLKATMMKVSDPIMFGHCVAVYYKEVLKTHEKTLAGLGLNLNNGLADLYQQLEKLPAAESSRIKKDIEALYHAGPRLAMVDSDKGITNLHVPNNVIIDASMPVFIRDGGRMWGPDGKLHDTVAMIPDRCYAGIYQAVVDDCKKHGAFDPARMGTVANIGLMAQKAEEYGSHDKTFEAPAEGVIRVVDIDSGIVYLEQKVESGDIFRMCQTKDEPIRDWVKLVVSRAKASGMPAIFWLDPDRGHDSQLIKKVESYLPKHDTTGLDIQTMKPETAMNHALARVRDGEDTIAVTGNVLRDYLTDLFPILELGTSARMLSIVPLMKGGGLFETGAGGSAPKHVQQFEQEGHLRWDSLGEFCALVPSFEHIAASSGNDKAKLLATTLDEAIGDFLENRRSPSRKVGELDSRGSHFYLALYWARTLAGQDEDQDTKTRFTKIAGELTANEDIIVDELTRAQGKPMDIGGYFQPDQVRADAVMRPSPTLNAIIDQA